MVYGEIEDSITYYSDHGTHVCGIVGARPASGAGTEMAGIAPGARLFSLQLNFSSPEEPNDQNLLLGDFLPQHTVRWSNLDIADAIYHLAQECEVNLINLSMTNAPGEERDSEAIHDAIRDVAELGTLCVAAAGNQGTPALAFPAAYREVVSVASLGKRGCGPQWDPNPQLPEYESQIADPFYLAKTSNRGEGLSCCAPGVRIISTVSVSNTYGLRPYLDMTGTSMAAPMVTGALAARLSQKGSAYTRLRGPERTQYARNLLPEICQNLGLARNLQGHGMVSAQKNEVASRILRC
jgi:subtilisin